jgi:twitching motility protein PilT
MMKNLLREAFEKRASDIHITVGVPPIFRINGELVHSEYRRLPREDTEKMFTEITNEQQQLQFSERGELDFSFALPNISRFRVNAFRQRGSVAIVVRIITEKIPTLEELGHPSVFRNLSRLPRGLVLITGPTGSGKSTTLAAMIDLINSERSCHILTLEDPIEYLHKHKKSIVNQREINSDTKSFTIALRAALREDPDVILVGEMRDPETIATAITAAETGHLVFATLHTGSAPQTIDRIIDAFPSHQQQQIRVQLSVTLQGIVAQQLLPRIDQKGRVAALEVLISTPAVRNIIREGKTHQLTSVIQTGIKLGMQPMDVSLRDLYRRSVISYEEAMSRALDEETFLRLINS